MCLIILEILKRECFDSDICIYIYIDIILMNECIIHNCKCSLLTSFFKYIYICYLNWYYHVCSYLKIIAMYTGNVLSAFDRSSTTSIINHVSSSPTSSFSFSSHPSPIIPILHQIQPLFLMIKQT